MELVEKGPLKAVIRVTRTWQSSKFVQDITLYNGIDRVDVVNDIDWHETHILLKAAFPLAASSSKATYRNSLWFDRAADDAEQQLGRCQVRGAGVALGGSG